MYFFSLLNNLFCLALVLLALGCNLDADIKGSSKQQQKKVTQPAPASEKNELPQTSSTASNQALDKQCLKLQDPGMNYEGGPGNVEFEGITPAPSQSSSEFDYEEVDWDEFETGEFEDEEKEAVEDPIIDDHKRLRHLTGCRLILTE